MKTHELILIHTPHLEDKYKGTRMILDMLRDEPRISPSASASTTSRSTRSALPRRRLLVGMTLYPITKCTPARAADMIEMYGTERIMVNSAGDWGKRPAGGAGVHLGDAPPGACRALIRKVVHDNPLTFFAQCARFEMPALTSAVL